MPGASGIDIKYSENPMGKETLIPTQHLPQNSLVSGSALNWVYNFSDKLPDAFVMWINVH